MKPIQQMYKTVYSPLYDCILSIERTYKDDNGDWIFVCTRNAYGIKECLFRELELKNFVL